MAEYKRLFGPSDISTKVNAFSMHSPIGREYSESGRITLHAINNALAVVGGFASLLLQHNQVNPAILPSTSFSSQLELLVELSSAVNSDFRYVMKNASEASVTLRACAALSDLGSIITSVEELVDKGEFTPEQNEHIAVISMSARVLFYTLNRYFAPNYQPGEFYLRADLDAFSAKAAGISRQNGVKITVPRIDEIVLRSDYFSEAILPLVSNSLEHAFNPDNDILERTQASDFTKAIIIYGSAAMDGIPLNGHNPANKNGYYTVTVIDNGFGICPEVLPNIFQEGATSKPADGTEHGVGLWGVKRVVEANGGLISFRTTLGRGTEFQFTIPCSSLPGSTYYVQR
ncbi:MAG TPA: HAMP domain-containing sensor histidine kinase [Candidatus Nanoarchaeia archaeon]|nr:HAMP domain-containing sensor histidine kinase [Candidatus Nanoarchaeia archaeon]